MYIIFVHYGPNGFLSINEFVKIYDKLFSDRESTSLDEYTLVTLDPDRTEKSNYIDLHKIIWNQPHVDPYGPEPVGKLWNLGRRLTLQPILGSANLTTSFYEEARPMNDRSETDVVHPALLPLSMGKPNQRIFLKEPKTKEIQSSDRFFCK
ncbi:hypothetical protein I4U23_023982 [Adineta vaga]|nr:hypothetical protein I4U23_023982 [Adineta vaga]